MRSFPVGSSIAGSGAGSNPDPRTMRVGMIAPPWFEIPPVGYGGIESVVADIVDQLSNRGHEVLLLGAGRHRTKAKNFVSTFDDPPSQRLGTALPDVVHTARVARALLGTESDLDIIHDHSLMGPLLAFGSGIPTVVTAHGPVDGDLGDYYAAIGTTTKLVAISDAQRQKNPLLNWVGTVHNAIDVASFPFRNDKDDYLLWVGRFCGDKAPHLAIEAARSVGLPIVLTGKLSEPTEHEYFQHMIEPILGPGTIYVGEVDSIRKRELFAGASVFVFPIQWDEPFGMVMIEAMACGTPVVAFRRGSVPEVVVDGVTGIIVDTPDQLPDAIRAARTLDPVACRRHVEEQFDLPVMAAGYERIYRRIIAGDGQRPR